MQGCCAAGVSTAARHGWPAAHGLLMETLFVSGFIWAEIKEMWDGGFTEYIHDWWNLMDFAMNSLYLATISLKIVAYVKVNISYL